MPVRVAAALVLGLWIAVPGAEATIIAGERPTASASAIANANAIDHGHRCKCGMSCKTACCCSQDETAAPLQAGAPPSPAASRDDDAGPCLASAPCRERETIPTAAPDGRVGPPAAAAAAIATRLPSATAGPLIPITPSAAPPTAAPARIDEPPEPCNRD